MMWIRHETPDGVRSLWFNDKKGIDWWYVIRVNPPADHNLFVLTRGPNDTDPIVNRLTYLQAELAGTHVSEPALADLAWLWRRHVHL